MLVIRVDDGKEEVQEMQLESLIGIGINPLPEGRKEEGYTGILMTRVAAGSFSVGTVLSALPEFAALSAEICQECKCRVAKAEEAVDNA